MKLKRNRFPSAADEKNNENQKGKSRGTELLAYAGTVVTILSTLAWTAGYSFNMGFWLQADLTNSYIVNTLQETMFAGIQAANSWMFLFFSLLAIGLFIFICSIRPNKPKVLAKNRKPPKLRLDESMSWFGISMIGVGYALIFGILIFALWIWSAASEGATDYRKLVCKVMKSDTPPNVIKLGNGTLLKGFGINRSDNFSLLLNKEGLHVVSIKKEPVIIEIVGLPKVTCGKEPSTQKT